MCMIYNKSEKAYWKLKLSTLAEAAGIDLCFDIEWLDLRKAKKAWQGHDDF